MIVDRRRLPSADHGDVGLVVDPDVFQIVPPAFVALAAEGEEKALGGRERNTESPTIQKFLIAVEDRAAVVEIVAAAYAAAGSIAMASALVVRGAAQPSISPNSDDLRTSPVGDIWLKFCGSL